MLDIILERLRQKKTKLTKKTKSRIYCVIREKDNINAIERFYEKFHFYFPNENSFVADL